MKYRLFGRNTGLRVSEIGLGTGLFGSPHSDAKGVFEVYVNAGGRFIDTAEGYQAGRSEELVGKLIGADRANFVIASKFGIGRTRNEPYGQKGNNRKAMMTAVEGSLRRLNTDYIDLYWQHGHDTVTPLEETLRGFDDLIRAGKIRYAGLSNFPAWRIARGTALTEAKNYAPITAISFEYSLAERTPERELLPMAEALGLGIGVWSPLGGGFLTRPDMVDGTPPSSHLAHWSGIGRPRPEDMRTLHELRRVAAEVGVTPGRVAHAWLLGQANRSTTALVPIIGASTGQQVEDTLAAANLVLSAEHLARLEAVSHIRLGEPHDHNNFHADLTEGGDYYPLPTPVV